uniref:Uncharacterized protein n=1 Tax=Nymphaea colorata TaxID=210225 RepID=A0A5K0W7X3_9MAGN
MNSLTPLSSAPILHLCKTTCSSSRRLVFLSSSCPQILPLHSFFTVVFLELTGPAYSALLLLLRRRRLPLTREATSRSSPSTTSPKRIGPSSTSITSIQRRRSRRRLVASSPQAPFRILRRLLSACPPRTLSTE